MKKLESVISALNTKSPLLSLYQHGYTPATIKQEIINDFSPFFKNVENLEKNAIDFLVLDWIQFLLCQVKYPNFIADLNLVLSSYNQAISTDNRTTIQTIGQLIPSHNNTNSKHWSFYKTEIKKADLELEEFAHAAMNDIGNSVEGLTKTLIIEQVIINRICRAKAINTSQVTAGKLGSHINELINCSRYPFLFKTSPDMLKISDWRNIAAHQSFTVVENRIDCEYGPESNRKCISITRDELFARLSHCVRTYNVLNMAHKIFTFDNLPEIQKFIPEGAYNVREESSFMVFAAGIMSQGFKIDSIDYEHNTTAQLVLQDLTEGNHHDRAIHSSQFLFGLWELTKKPKLVVQYKTSNGQIYLTSECDAEACEKIANGEEEPIYLAHNVQFRLSN